MNPLADTAILLPPVLAAVFSGGLALIVGRRGWRNAPHRYFTLFLLTISAWSFLIFLMRGAPTPSGALFWERLVIPLMLSTPPVFYFFARAYTRVDHSRTIPRIALLYLGIVVALGSAGLLVDRMIVQGYGYAPIFKPAFYPIALGGYIWMGVGIYDLYRAYRRSRVYEERNRLLYIIVATSFPVIGTILDIFPSTYPTSIIGNLVFGTVTTLAMRRYQLLDISLVIRKGLAYLAMSALVALPYVGIIVLASQLFQESMRPVINALLIIALALALQPLWHRVQGAVDRVFFRRRWDSFRAIQEFTHRSHSIAELDKPANELVEIIRSAVASNAVALLLPFEDSDFESVAASGKEDGVGTLRIERRSPIVIWMEEHRSPLEIRYLDQHPQLQILSERERRELSRAGATVLVPLQMRDRISGMLVLGEKLAETPYSKEDLTLLSLVAQQSAVLLDDARLYENLSSQLELGRRRLRAFRDAATKLALEQDSERALQDLVDTAHSLVGARAAGLVLYDSKGELGRLVQSGAADQQSVPSAPVVSNGRRGGFHPSEGHHTSSNGTMLSVPIAGRDHSAGLLYVREEESGHRFSDDDEGILSLFAVHAQVLLENMDLYNQISQERRTLAAIQASITEGLLVLDADGRVRYCNQVAASLWSAQPEDVLERPIHQVFGPRIGDLEKPEGLQELIETVDNAGRAPQQLELRFLRPAEKDIVVTVFPIPSAPTLNMVGLLFRDVTKEREVDRRRNEFVSVASHELRTPMSTLLGFSELLLHGDIDEETRRQWLEFMYRDSKRLTSIIDDMLDVSRIQSGKVQVRLEPVSMPELISHVVETARTTTQKHKFQVRLPDELQDVVADRDKATQVLTNLVNNAVKYSPDGGNIIISAASSFEDGMVRISVKDQGLGISKEDQERLFSTFYRVRNSDTESIRGTGLGLYIVRSVLNLMGGDVWVESELNRGSTFHFTLPMAMSENGAPPHQNRDTDERADAPSFREESGSPGRRPVSLGHGQDRN